MSDYQALNSEIRVPQEWPVEIARSAFIDVAEFAISHYLPEKKIILRVGKVPTVVIRSETGWKYLFKKIEGTGDEDASILINLILPEEVTLLHSNNNDENRSGERRIECLPMIVKSNIFNPKMFSSSSEYCKILVPDTKKIFEREGITGPDADRACLMVKYKLWLPKMILGNIDQAEGAPSTSAASTTSSEMDLFEDWDVIFLDSLRKSPNRIERTASKRWRGSVRRVVSAAVFNLSCFTHGCSTGWVSGVLGPEALTGGAWLAALPCLVALPAAPFFAFLADSKGRKAGALCICISFILSWSLAAWCGPRGVWAARVAAGAGGAGALALAPLYCAEISPKTKGLAAMPTLAMSCGILFAFVAGGVLSAHALSLYMAAPPTVLLLSLVWLPETPSFLISVGRMQDAAKVICWLDGSDFREDLTDAIEQQEVMIRTEPARRESDALQPMLRHSRSEGTSEGKENSVCRDLFRHRRSRRALFSCCLLLTAAAGSGAGAVNSFATAVLRHSGHALPALNITAYNFTVYNGTVSRGWRETSETGSVLCGTALVLGAAVATVTVDRFGRKVLLLISCVGIAFSLAILGLYCDPRAHMYSWYSHQLWPYRKTSAIKEKIHNFTVDMTKDNLRNQSDTKPYKMEDASALSIETLKTEKVNNTEEETSEVDHNATKINEEDSIWASVILQSIVLFLYNIGLGSVPYVLISELFSINVRSLASSLLISWMWLCNFTTLRYFGSLAATLGLHGTYYVCASITLLASGYIYFMLPETRGKNQKQIDDLLSGPLLVHLKRKRKTNET